MSPPGCRIDGLRRDAGTLAGLKQGMVTAAQWVHHQTADGQVDASAHLADFANWPIGQCVARLERRERYPPNRPAPASAIRRVEMETRNHLLRRGPGVIPAVSWMVKCSALSVPER